MKNRYKNRSWHSGFSAGLLLSLVTSTVTGQDAPRNQGVLDRQRPDYDAKGLPFGAFRLYPRLDVEVVQDDNVYRTETDTQDDLLQIINPGVDLESDWTRHLLRARANLAQYYYTDLDSENRTDWNTSADGRIDVTRDLSLTAAMGYSQLHEMRNSPDLTRFMREPTQYARTHAEAAMSYAPNRLGLAWGVSYDRYGFDPTPLIGGGELDNEDRDRDVASAFVRVAYQVSPDFSLFARLRTEERDFDLAVDRSGLDRDSSGLRYVVGSSFLVSDLVDGKAFVGGLEQNYHAPLRDVRGADYGVELHWYASPLITVHLSGARELLDTTIAGASAIDQKSVEVGADYELLRNLIVLLDLGYFRQDFPGATRQDDTGVATLSARYLINRYMSATAKYAFSQRDSNIGGQSYDDNTISVGLRLQL